MLAAPGQPAELDLAERGAGRVRRRCKYPLPPVAGVRSLTPAARSESYTQLPGAHRNTGSASANACDPGEDRAGKQFTNHASVRGRYNYTSIASMLPLRGRSRPRHPLVSGCGRIPLFLPTHHGDPMASQGSSSGCAPGRSVKSLDFVGRHLGPAIATPSNGSVPEDPTRQPYRSVFPARARRVRKRLGSHHMVPYGPWAESKFLSNSTTICSRF
jgi:hypothetical protein